MLNKTRKILKTPKSQQKLSISQKTLQQSLLTFPHSHKNATLLYSTTLRSFQIATNKRAVFRNPEKSPVCLGNKQTLADGQG
jgi:hypothetical protein